LTVVHLKVPPLRERCEDLPVLIDHISARHGKVLTFSDAAMRAMRAYRWPGNVRELQNTIEQLIWMRAGEVIEPADLPAPIGETTLVAGHPAERRRQPADEIFDALVSRSCGFWEHVYPLFINRDITKHDLAGVIRRGLTATSGNYRALLNLLGMEQGDYKRFLNLLSTHDCAVDFRQYRSGGIPAEPIAPSLKLRMLKAGSKDPQPEANPLAVAR
jgi:DNA-binding NtrC family response regulator